ncbi:bifunctional copper resistance protein CopD/cytochrome c oxidase assembly protein [Arthrobacter sp. AETb3-4]|uniref:Bifunctional copper resistance protein CopD/cytochrome c oxidase assembly protein n=1 Tax=Arthrobacter wenxiniae TaxID=2713570 RepID=A0A7Y7IJK3_9MICC|nr:bifunctional copper resistance protein CopD/cytochrome c oxidase assembly protein [Arthrobacter wenxiniae]
MVQDNGRVPPVESAPAASPRPDTTAPRAVRQDTFAGGVRGPWWWLGLAAAVAGVVGALLWTGAAGVQQLGDPGSFTRWGLPLATTIHNMALATVVGALVFAIVILPKDAKPRRPRTGKQKLDSASHAHAPEHPAFTRVMTLAAVAGGVWTVAAIAVLVLTYSSISGLAVSGSSDYTNQLVFYMTELPVGQAWLMVVICAAVTTTMVFGLRNISALAVPLVVAMLSFVPQALIGHSASSADHVGAVNSLFLHITSVSLWVGGIVVLVVVSGVLGSITAQTLQRFSALAIFAFAGVAGSGVVNAAIRITNWHDLFHSTYGQLILAKSAATIVLGVIGWMHRTWIIPRLAGGQKSTTAARTRRLLWQLVFGELLIMGVTSGIAVGLSRSAPPQSRELVQAALTPAQILTDYPLPPELTFARWFTEWRMDWLWVAFAVAAGAAYLSGLVKLRRRGDKWSVLRTVSWFTGLLSLVYITSGGTAVYGQVLFSAHMVEHMSLMVIAPLFLALGSPVSLALQALTPRRDGSRGIREWILVLVHSRFSQLITHPLFAAANFAGSLIIFYYSPLFNLAMRYHVGHELMIVHFTLTGYIFIMSMIGTDPLPFRFPYAMRLLLLLATMAFHAFFGVSLMMATNLLSGEYFGNMGRPWGDSALVDQQTAGGIAWGVGEIPTLAIAMGVAYMWAKSDARETKRKDRAAVRNNYADLNAYNDMFAQLAARDATTDPAHSGPPLPHLHNGKPPAASGAVQATATQPDSPSGSQGEKH